MMTLRLPCPVRRRGAACAAALAMLAAGAAPAWSQTLHGDAAPASLWLAASDQQLDQLRGGFDFGAGLLVSFGISRSVYINGQLLATTTFNLADLGKLTPTQAVALAQQIGAQPQLVQNGPGNTVAPEALAVPLATYIQNTLNDQTLRNQTVIQASTNGLSLVKNMNLQATINEAIANAMGKR